jgi:hypothetical protein
MIEYSTDIIEHAKKLNSRFLIIKIMDLCNEKARKYIDTSDISISFGWFDVKRELRYLLEKYDNNIKVDDNMLMELYHKLNNMESPPKIIIIERIIKLITLV